VTLDDGVAMTRLVRLAMITCTVVGWIALAGVWPTMVAAAGTQHARATIHWDHVPLGEAVARLADVLEVDVLVDRRVDPNQRVSLTARDASAEEILAQLAADRSLGVSHLGTLLYLGPRAAADELRTLAAVRQQEVAGLPGEERAALDRKQVANWPRLTEPRQLVVGLLRERGWDVRQAELIPHDLWPAGRLPALTLSDQLTALLVGFDLTFRLVPGRRAVEIVAIDEPVRLARRYQLPAGSPLDVHILRRQFPEASVHVEGQSLQLVGQLEDHERLTEMLQRQGARREAIPQKRPARRVFTLHVEDQPVGTVLRQLERQLGLEIDVDDAAVRAADLSLDRRVSLAVEGVGLDELLDALLAPAGLDYERDAERVRVFPRSAK
jgi:hypothetical protein